ncbi:MAG: hypothetical protein N4A46_10830 [Schleiferiaceae bacterium]|jgi:hypothetical protein|nr:hypothetical protein [Schleiferiaceae bacterium]
MNLKFHFLLVVLAAYGVANAQYIIPNTVNTQSLKLKGDVKSIHQVQTGGRYDRYSQEFYFNTNGGLTEKKGFNPKGNPLSYNTFTINYNEKGLPVERIKGNSSIYFQYDENDCIDQVQTDYYVEQFYVNKDCQVFEVKKFNNTQELRSTEMHYYNDKNQVVKTLYTSANSDTSSTFFSYDENGNETEIRSSMMKAIMEYNEQGHKTLWKQYNSKGELKIHMTYAYTYDEKSNWIKMEQTNVEDNEVSVLTRNIEYYE